MGNFKAWPDGWCIGVVWALGIRGFRGFVVGFVLYNVFPQYQNHNPKIFHGYLHERSQYSGLLGTLFRQHLHIKFAYRIRQFHCIRDSTL